MDKKQKVAVIGTGNWGLNHAKVYSRSNVAELSCIVGRTESKVKERAEHFNVPHFTNIKTMMNKIKPDLVSVALPGMKCYETLMELINEGVPIITEKPLTYDLKLADRLMNEAEKKNVFLGVNFIHRYAKPVQLAYDAIQDNKIGKIAFIVWKLGQYGVCRNHIYENLIETQCHGLDLLEYLCGEIESVQAEMNKISNRGFTTTGITLKFKNGAVGTYLGTYDAMERYRPSQYLEVNGTLGRIYIEDFVRKYTIQNMGNEFLEEWKSSLFNEVDRSILFSFDKHINAVVHALTEKKKPPIGAQAGFRTLLLASKIIESFETGQRIFIS